MNYNQLNLFEFLLYLELLFVLITIINAFIITPLLMIITSIFDVISYKVDAINLYLNIPFTILEIVLIKILIDVNAPGSSDFINILFYLGGLLIFVVNRLIHQKGVYELAIKENNFLLKYDARKYFKITRWLYPVIFIAIIFLGFDFANPVTSLLFTVLNWLYHLKYVGWLLPTLSFLLLNGSIIYSIFFLFNYRKLKRRFEEDFYHDVMNG